MGDVAKGFGEVTGDIGGAVGGAAGGLVGGIGAGASRFAPQSKYQAPIRDLPDQEERNKRFLEQINAYKAGQDPAQARAAQMDFINRLNAQAQGQGGPSVAANLLNQATNQNLANSMALGASQRGDVNPAAIARQVQANQMITQQNAAQQLSQLRAQEQLQAQQLLGGQLGQLRGQDVQIGQLQANYEAMGLDAAKARMLAMIEADKINSGVSLGNTQMANTFAGGVMGGLASVGGQMAKSGA